MYTHYCGKFRKSDLFHSYCNGVHGCGTCIICKSKTYMRAYIKKAMKKFLEQGGEITSINIQKE
jgi:hypothetical protein